MILLYQLLTHNPAQLPTSLQFGIPLSSDLSPDSLANWIRYTTIVFILLVPSNLLALWLIEQLFIIHNVASAFLHCH